MIAPVYEPNAPGRYVYLPEDMLMVRFKSDTEYDCESMTKGHHFIEIPVTDVVIFIRDGQALPIVKAAMHTDDIDLSTMTFITNNNGGEYELVTEEETKTVTPTLTYDATNKRLVASYVTVTPGNIQSFSLAYDKALQNFEFASEKYKAALRDDGAADAEVVDKNAALQEKIDALLAAEKTQKEKADALAAAQTAKEKADAAAQAAETAVTNAQDAKDTADAAVTAAQEDVDSAREAYNAAVTDAGTTSETVASAEADYLAKQKALAEAEAAYIPYTNR